MKLLDYINSLLLSWGVSPSAAGVLDDVAAFVLILLVAFLADAVCRHFVLRAVAHLV